jgi:hypothetical protein
VYDGFWNIILGGSKKSTKAGGSGVGARGAYSSRSRGTLAGAKKEESGAEIFSRRPNCWRAPRKRTLVTKKGAHAGIIPAAAPHGALSQTHFIFFKCKINSAFRGSSLKNLCPLAVGREGGFYSTLGHFSWFCWHKVNKGNYLGLKSASKKSYPEELGDKNFVITTGESPIEKKEGPFLFCLYLSKQKGRFLPKKLTVKQIFEKSKALFYFIQILNLNLNLDKKKSEINLRCCYLFYNWRLWLFVYF